MTKRVLDFLLASTGLLILFPIMFVIAVCIRLDSSGPIIFRQERIGLSGRTFRLLKFRTMFNRASNRTRITTANDDRVTRIGRTLRYYKLDELPQLWNVIRGEMSLVGPRPELAEFVAHYPKESRDKILSVRPGITDLASVAYRDEEALLSTQDDPRKVYIEDILPKKIAYYESYVDQQSIWLDFRLIMMTLQAIMGNRGQR